MKEKEDKDRSHGGGGGDGSSTTTSCWLWLVVWVWLMVKSFREISLSGLVYEDSTVEALAINCSRLRHLSLGFNEHMTTQVR